MKKVILCVFYFFSLFLSLNTLQAQAINKGDRLFGGSFSFSFFNSNNNGLNYSNIGNAGIIPSYGWALKNDLVFGIRGFINYEHSEWLNTPTDKNTRNSFSFGPGLFLKKYKLLKNKFGMYLNNELSGIYSTSKQKSTNFPDYMKSHSWGVAFNLNPGVFYKFSDNFFGEGNIGGLSAFYNSNGTIKNSGISATFLQYFNLGINYRIANNK